MNHLHQIRFGAHIFFWTERWTSKQISIMDTAKNLGLDCLEIAVGDDVVFEPAVVQKHAHQTGLELIISPGGVWPMEADIAHQYGLHLVLEPMSHFLSSHYGNT